MSSKTEEMAHKHVRDQMFNSDYVGSYGSFIAGAKAVLEEARSRALAFNGMYGDARFVMLSDLESLFAEDKKEAE